MMNTTTKPNKTQTTAMSSKAVLARLMATENLSVNVDPRARTASFNLKQRELTLPLWDVNDETYTMLVGHESAHAIYTPEAYIEESKKLCPKAPAIGFQYMNVVEDVRIERLIKGRFPGLRRSFVQGYRELSEKTEGFKIPTAKQLATMSFIDRINIHYKLGFMVNVPFSAEELPLARRCASIQTWDDTVQLAKEIYEFAKEQKQQQQDEEQQQGEKPEQPEPQQGEPCEDGNPGEQQGGKSPSDEQGDDESENSDGEGQDGDGEEGEESSTGSDSEGEEGDKGASGTDGEEGEEESKGSKGSEGDEEASEGTEKGENPSNSDEKSENSATSGVPDAGSKGGDTSDIIPDAATTVEAFEKAMESLAQASAAFAGASTVSTIDLPKWERGMVVPFATVESVMDRLTNRKSADALFGTWKSEESKNVQTLWTEFERRKAADRLRRVMVSETGTIDPIRVAHYRVSDNIFRSQTMVAKGKNHGIVLFLDMSASMNDKIFSTIIQLANLTAFARRAQIPFVVYGFHETDERQTLNGPKAGFTDARWHPAHKTNYSNRKVFNSGCDLRLYTLLTSGTSQGRFQKQVGNLLEWARVQSQTYWNDVAPKAYKDAARSVGHFDQFHVLEQYEKAGLGLSNTPTATTLLLSLDLVSEFKATNRLQVVNTIFLTDGGNNDEPLSVLDAPGIPNSRMLPVLRDPVTRREYKAFSMVKGYGGSSATHLHRHAQQRLLAQILRDRVGGNVMSIGLAVSNYQAEQCFAYAMGRVEGPEWVTLMQGFKDKGWACKKNEGEGYSHVAVLKIESGRDQNTSQSFKDYHVMGTGRREMTKLQKQFVTSLTAKKSNKALMVEIAKIICGQLA